MTPHVPDPISSLSIPRSNLTKPESHLERNTQELIDQVKSLIQTLRLLLKNKTNKRSCADRSKNKLFSEEMTIMKCNFPVHHSRKSTIVNTGTYCIFLCMADWQRQLPISDNDPPNQLQRCLLVHCRNRSDRIDINQRQSHLHRTWNHATSREYLALSTSSPSLSDKDKNMLSSSKSSVILAGEDDQEHDSLDLFSRLC